jgi:FtsH-binding integral membrane protein
MSWRAVFRPGMRAYFIPLLSGIALSVSAFLPWIHIGDVALEGMTEMSALWILGLGALAAVLATLSLITRRNSRHPLLVIGLVALGIMFLSWRIMPRMAVDRALTRLQAVAIVEGLSMGDPPTARIGSGIYLGLVASSILVAFGMTIVLKRASQPYIVVATDDDVE